MVRTLRSRPVENGRNHDGTFDHHLSSPDPARHILTKIGNNLPEGQKHYAFVDRRGYLTVGGLDDDFLKSLETVDSDAAPSKRGRESESVKDVSRKRRRLDVATPQTVSPRTRSKGNLDKSNASPQAESLLISNDQALHSKTNSNEEDSQTPLESPEKLPVAEIVEPDDAQDDIILVRPSTYVARSQYSTPARTPTPASSIPSPTRDELVEPEAQPGTSLPLTDPNELTEADLPPAFLPRNSRSPSPSAFTDQASYIQAVKFAPIPPPSRFIGPLTSHSPADRSTETLRTLAFNVQKALRVWQEEYIALDKHTAPVATNPPKKPATGGRIPVAPSAFDAAKEAELFASGGPLAALKPKSRVAVSTSTHHNTTPAIPVVVSSADPGRELRRRHADASIINGLGISDDDAGATSTREKRPRRPVRRFESGLLDDSANVSDGAPRGRGRGRGSTNGGSRGRGSVRGNTRGRGSFRVSYLSATPEVGDGYSNGEDELTGGRRTPISRRGSATAASRARTSSTTRGGRGSRGKSEKRSESMTAWWAARKKKAAEEKRLRELKEQQEKGLADATTMEGEREADRKEGPRDDDPVTSDHANSRPTMSTDASRTVSSAPMSASAASPTFTARKDNVQVHSLPPSQAIQNHGPEEWRHVEPVRSYTTEVYNSSSGTPVMSEINIAQSPPRSTGGPLVNSSSGHFGSYHGGYSVSPQATAPPPYPSSGRSILSPLPSENQWHNLAPSGGTFGRFWQQPVQSPPTHQQPTPPQQQQHQPQHQHQNQHQQAFLHPHHQQHHQHQQPQPPLQQQQQQPQQQQQQPQPPTTSSGFAPGMGSMTGSVGYRLWPSA